MNNVIPINIKSQRATDRQKAEVFLRILKAASKYVAYAQSKGVYDGWEHEGSELCNLIDRMVLENPIQGG